MEPRDVVENKNDAQRKFLFWLVLLIVRFQGQVNYFVSPQYHFIVNLKKRSCNFIAKTKLKIKKKTGSQNAEFKQLKAQIFRSKEVTVMKKSIYNEINSLSSYQNQN